MTIDYKNRILGLDIMRAVAIFLVVGSNLYWIVPNISGLPADVLSLAGVIGVELFFVLSGYLIGKIMYTMYLQPDFQFKNVKNFWIRRWFRTLPNYYLVLAINIVIASWLSLSPPDGLWRYFFFLQNFAYEMPLFFNESWSLSIEEFAYILAPLLLCMLSFVNIKGKKSTIFGWVVSIILVMLFLSKVLYNQVFIEKSNMLFWNANLKGIVIYRLDAVYYGVFAAYGAVIFPKIWKKYAVFFCIIGVLIFITLNIAIPLKQLYIESDPFFWNVLYLPINSITIAFLLPLLSQLKTAPKILRVPITYISVISYSIYLLHYSVILQLMKYFLPTENLPRFDLAIYIITYLAIVILCSYLLYVVYEKPMTDIRDKITSK